MVVFVQAGILWYWSFKKACRKRWGEIDETTTKYSWCCRDKKNQFIILYLMSKNDVQKRLWKRNESMECVTVLSFYPSPTQLFNGLTYNILWCNTIVWLRNTIVWLTLMVHQWPRSMSEAVLSFITVNCCNLYILKCFKQIYLHLQDLDNALFAHVHPGVHALKRKKSHTGADNPGG